MPGSCAVATVCSAAVALLTSRWKCGVAVIPIEAQRGHERVRNRED